MDSNFINDYIETALSTSHDLVNNLVQVKTQLKVSNKKIAQLEALLKEKDDALTQAFSKSLDKENDLGIKDMQIEELQKRLEFEQGQINDLNNRLASATDKVYIIDNLRTQINELKSIIKSKDEELETKDHAIRDSLRQIASISSKDVDQPAPKKPTKREPPVKDDF